MSDSTQSEKVTIRDGFALAALAAAAGRPARECAAVAGVCERTIRRWNRKPSFVAMVERLRDQLLSDTMGRLLATNGQAVDALSSLLVSEQDNVKLGAAGRLLELTLRARHQLNLQKQIEEIQDQIEKYKKERESLEAQSN